MMRDANVTRHVIVVESNVHDYVLISHALREGGTRYALRQVRTAMELDEELRRQVPDLVICDQGGSAWEAREVLAQVNDFAAGLPVIVLYIPGADAAGLDAGRPEAAGCLGKDCLGRLPAMVDRVWRRRVAGRHQGTDHGRKETEVAAVGRTAALEPAWSAGYVG